MVSVLILSLDGQGTTLGSGSVSITTEVEGNQVLTLRSARVIYTDTDGYTAEPIINVSFPFLSSVQINGNQTKCLIPLPTSNGLDTTSLCKISFSLTRKIPHVFRYDFFDDDLNLITGLDKVILIFEYKSVSIN